MEINNNDINAHTNLEICQICLKAEEFIRIENNKFCMSCGDLFINDIHLPDILPNSQNKKIKYRKNSRFNKYKNNFKLF